MLIVGIDPGRKGAICEYWEDKDHIALYQMTIETFAERANQWTVYPEVAIYLEKAQAMSKQGVVSMFSYGRHFGQLEGILMGNGLDYNLIAPQSWTSKMTKTYAGDNAKQRASSAAKFLFPDVNLLATKRSRKPHDGFVDALLIAEYGRQKELLQNENNVRQAY